LDKTAVYGGSRVRRCLQRPVRSPNVRSDSNTDREVQRRGIPRNFPADLQGMTLKVPRLNDHGPPVVARVLPLFSSPAAHAVDVSKLGLAPIATAKAGRASIAVCQRSSSE